MRIAYLINQYPKVSHSFIRREIAALEALGAKVTRIAIRGWDDTSPEREDGKEKSRTRYVLRSGLPAVFLGALVMLFHAPARWLAGLMLATRMSRRSDRALWFHLVYFAEACVVARWVGKEKACHLHAHFGSNPAEVAMLAATIADRPFSFTAHGTVETDNAEFLGLREKISRARFVVAVSDYGRSQLCRWAEPEDWQKIHVVRCGIDASFQDEPVVAVQTSNRLVCVGRLSAEKGQLVLIDALRRLIASGTSCELVLAGDGEMRQQIQARIDVYGLRNSVRITGWISGEQVRAEIEAARALVLPSFAEGLPVVLMESLALRRPVIASQIAGVPELVTAGTNGWLVPPGNAAALSDAIQECLGSNQATLASMGDAGRMRALARHDVNRLAAELLALFNTQGFKQ